MPASALRVRREMRNVPRRMRRSSQQVEGNQESLGDQAAKGRTGMGVREGPVAFECRCEQGEAENAHQV